MQRFGPHISSDSHVIRKGLNDGILGLTDNSRDLVAILFSH